MWGSANGDLCLEATHWSTEIFSELHCGQRFLLPRLPSTSLRCQTCTVVQRLSLLCRSLPLYPSRAAPHWPSLQSVSCMSNPVLASVSWRTWNDTEWADPRVKGSHTVVSRWQKAGLSSGQKRADEEAGLKDFLKKEWMETVPTMWRAREGVELKMTKTETKESIVSWRWSLFEGTIHDISSMLMKGFFLWWKN